MGKKNAAKTTDTVAPPENLATVTNSGVNTPLNAPMLPPQRDVIDTIDAPVHVEDEEPTKAVQNTPA